MGEEGKNGRGEEGSSSGSGEGRSTQCQTEAVGSREPRGLNLHDGYLLCFTLSVPASLSQLSRGHLQTLAQTPHKCHFVVVVVV